MTASSEFTSSLTESTHDTFDCVHELGLRIWDPAGVYTVPDDGLVHLLYVLDGILSCEPATDLSRVLPREVLRIHGGASRTLKNPSRSDPATAVQLTLAPADGTTMSTRHHYFSDDQKDNKLCRIAAFERDGRTLGTRAPVDVYLTALGRYDTVLLDRHADQPLLVMCPRGKVTVNTAPIGAHDPALSIETESASIVGLRPCTVLIIRGQNTQPG